MPSIRITPRPNASFNAPLGPSVPPSPTRDPNIPLTVCGVVVDAKTAAQIAR